MQPYRLYRRTLALFWERLVNRVRQLRSRRRTDRRRRRGDRRVSAETLAWQLRPLISLESRVLLTTIISTDQIAPGQNLVFSDPQQIIIDAGVMLDTSSTTGAAGSITLSAPMITIGDGVQISATGSTPGGAGSITLTANNVQTFAVGLPLVEQFRDLAPYNSSITLGSSVLIDGGAVSLQTWAGQSVAANNSISHVNSVWGDVVNDFVNDLRTGFGALPLSMLVKQPSATITIGSGSAISSTGSVTVAAKSTPYASSQAVFGDLLTGLIGTAWAYKGIRDQSVGFAGAYSYTDAIATAELQSSATINALGSVSITTSTINTTQALADAAKNVTSKIPDVDPNTIAASLGVSILNTTSIVRVDQGSSITAGGTVFVEASAKDESGAKVHTDSYKDGLVGTSFAYSQASANVQAIVNGSITAGSEALLPTLTFNPDLVVNFASDSLVFPSATGYATGDALFYNPGPGAGGIPGLLPDVIYYVISNPGTPNSLQLATTYENALNGQPISFGTGYPTLTSSNGTLPIVLVADDSSGQISYDFGTWANGNPLFTTGESVTYTPLAGNVINYSDSNGNYLGILPAGTYTVQVINSQATDDNPYTIELLDSSGNVLLLNTNPLLTAADGTVYQISTFQLSNSAIDLNFPTQGTGTGQVSYPTPNQSAIIGQLTNGAPLVYSQALGLQFSGLVDGVTYYAVVNPATPGIIQLAASASQAAAANPAVEYAMPTLGAPGGQTLFSNQSLIASVTDTLTGGVSTLGSSLAQGLYNTAASGTFVLNLTASGTGFTTAAIPYNATAAQVATAIQNASAIPVTVTGSGTPANPWVITPPSGSTQVLMTGTTDSLTDGSSTLVSVSQSLSNTATGGSFVLNLTANGQTLSTAALTYNATAAEITAAIQSVSGVATSVTGSGTAGDPWIITPVYSQSIGNFQPGVGLVYDIDPGLVDGTAVVYQAVPGKPIAGLVNGQTYYVFNQPNQYFQSNFPQYVLGLSTTQASPTLVSFTEQQSFTDGSGNEYQVTGFDAANNQVMVALPTSASATVSANQGNLVGGTATVGSVGSGSVQIANNAHSGTFTISVTPTAGGSALTTAALDFNATADEVAAALNALTGVSVTVTGTGLPTSPWLISGTGLNEMSTDDSNLSSGPAMAWSNTTSVGVVNLSNNAQGGTFTITVSTGAGQTATTSAMPWCASASQVASALNALSGVNVWVTGAGTSADPWVIYGTGLTGLSTDDSQLMNGQYNNTITAPAAFSVITYGAEAAEQIWTNASSGSFTISVTYGNGNTHTTVPIPSNASAQELFSALYKLNGNSVWAVTGSGTSTNPWTILGNSGASVSLNSSELSLGIASWTNATTAGVLDLWNNAAGGTFSITVTPVNETTQTTAALPWNATAAELAAALNALTGVSVSVTGAGTSANPWQLLGSGLSGLSTNDSALTPAAGATVAGSQNATTSVPALELWNDAGFGTFTLSVVSGSGQVQTTAALPFDATAEQVAAALNQLSGVDVWGALGSGGFNDPWTLVGTGFDTLSADSSQLFAAANTSEGVPQATQTVSTTATSGTITLSLTVGSQTLTTPDIPWNATAGQVAAALNSQSGVAAWVSGAGTSDNPWLIQVFSIPLQTGDALTFNDAWGQPSYGLLNGTVYYAVQPSLGQPGSVVLGLAASAGNALATPAVVVPLQNIQLLGLASINLMSGVGQTLSPVFDSSGILIRARLESNDDTGASADLGSTCPLASLPTSGNLLTARVYNLIASKQGWPSAKIKKPTTQQVNQGDAGNMYAGSFNGVLINNTVQAIVGSTANLLSPGSITVSSQLEEKLKSKAKGGVTVGKMSNLGIAVALDITKVHNTSQAWIAPGAQVTGGSGVAVEAEIEYPPPTLSDYLDMLKLEMPANVWVTEGADHRNLSDVWLRNSISTALNFVDYTNTCLAQIAAGAQINTNNAQLAGMTVTSQPVTVNANTRFQQSTVNALTVSHTTGIFNSWPFNKVAKLQKLASKGNKLLAFPSGTNVFGGSYTDLVLRNDTEALLGGVDPANDPVTQPTTVYFGSGGLNVGASIDLNLLQLMEAGGTATNYGVMGTLGMIEIPEQQTVARILPVQPSGTTTGPVLVVQANPGVTGDMTVSANDQTLITQIAGQALASANVGVGASVAQLDVNRTVIAEIGTPSGTPPLKSQMEGLDDVTVSATATGDILPFALSGAFPSGGAGHAHGNAHNAGAANPVPAGAANQASGSSFGVGISGDVAVARVTDIVSAFINDSGTLAGQGGTLKVSANDNTTVVASTGGWSQISAGSQPTSVGMAGSVAITDVTSTVTAGLNAVTITDFALDLSATTDLTVLALAAGGTGGTLGNSALSVAGSIAYNTVQLNSAVVVTGVTGTGLTGVSASAVEDSLILAVAGSLNIPTLKAVGGDHGGNGGFRIGVGLSGALNDVESNAGVQLSDTNLSVVDGPITLAAQSTPSLYAFSAGVMAGQPGVALGGQFTNTLLSSTANVAINQGSQITSTSTAPNAGLSLQATLSPMVISVAGNVLYNTNGDKSYLSAGAAVTTLTVTGSANAQIDDSTVNLTAGDVELVTISGPPPDDNQEQLNDFGQLNLPLYDGSNNFYSFAVGADVSNALVDGDFSMTFNTISGWDLSAQITNGSNVTTAGDVLVLASDNSEIISGAGSLAVLLTPEQEESVSLQAAVGAAVTQNTVTASVLAQIVNSTVTGTGAGSTVTVEATSARLISTGAAGGQAVSGTGEGGDDAAISAGTAVTVNTIDSTVTSQIAGTTAGSTTVTSPGGITVEANDATQIGSGAGQIDLSLLLKEGSPAYVAFSAAAAAAVNTVNQSVTAEVSQATLDADAGQVVVAADANATVTSNATGVSFTLTTTGALVEFTGAGSGAGNTVNSSVSAEVTNSTVSAEALQVTATDDTSVEASAGTLAIQISPTGSQAFFSAAMGISIAENTLGSSGTPNQVLAEVVDSTLNLTGANGGGLALEISAVSTVDSTAATAAGAGQYSANTSLPWTGVGAQSLNTVYQSVNAQLQGGTAIISGAGGVAISAQNLTTSHAGAGGLAFAGYTSEAAGGNKLPLLLAVSVGAALSSNDVTLETSALMTEGVQIQMSAADPGSLSVTANSAATIESVAVGVAGVLSLADKETLLSLGGAGSSAVNQVTSTVTGQIAGSSTAVQGLDSATIEATDQNSVIAGSGAGSFAGGLKVDVAVSVGVSLSENTIDGSVTAGVVDGATLGSQGSVTVAASAEPASSRGNAYAVAVAGSGAFSVDGLASPLIAAGAGAGITNTRTYTILAQVDEATVSAGSLSVSASDNSVLYSNAGGVGLTFGEATGFQIGIAVGAAQGTNTVATTVQAQIVDSTVTTTGSVSVAAESQASIESIAYGVALGLEAVDAGASTAGSGAAAYNNVTNSTVASLTGGRVLSQGSGGDDALQVTATDEANISASAGAGGFGGIVGDGVGLAVGAVVTQNTINNSTQAYVGTLNPPAGTTPAGTLVTVTGPVTIAANSAPTATSMAVAVAASTDIGEGLALAGSGANAITTLGPATVGGVQVLAGIVNGANVVSQPTSAGQNGVSVQASYQPDVTSNVGTGAGTIGLFGASVGVSLGTITDNTTVQTVVESATVNAAGGNIALQTSSKSAFDVEVVPTSVSVSLGAAGAGGNAIINDNAQYQVEVAASNALTANTLSVLASSQDALNAQIIGVDTGALSIGAFLATANRGGSTAAVVNLPASLDINNLSIAAQTQQSVETDGSSVSVGLFSGAGETLTSILTEQVSAQLLNAGVDSPLDLAGTFQITAGSNNNVQAYNGIGSADVSVSTLGVGVYQSFATSAPTVGVLVEGVEVQADGPILVFAEATSVTTSQTKSGTGSLLSGMASEATTTNNPTVSAQISGGSLQTSGQLQFLARNTSQYNLLSDSTNAALIGGSGTVGTNNGTANVTTSIDADTTLVGQQGVLVTAYNTFESVGQQPSVLGGAGGAADTNTAKLNTNLAANVSVEVGEAAAITGNGSTGVQIAALTNSNISESAQISTGGLLENTNALTNLTLNFTPSVQVSSNAQINAPQGSLGIGTMANVLASSGASGTTYGVAGVVVSNSTVDVTVNPDIVIGTGASLAGNTVAVSTDSLPLLPYSSLLAVNSQAYANTGTVVPIWEHSASATVNSNGTVTIGTGATITAQQDVLLEANPLQAVPSASIIGKTLYTSAKRKTGDTATNLTGLLTLDGTVVAGSVNTLDIAIDSYTYPSTVYVTVNGQTAAATVEPGLGKPTPAITPNSSATSPFLPFSAAFDPNFNAQALLTGLSAANLGLVSGFVSSTPIQTMQLSNVQAAGGQVVINAAGVQGSGTVEANLPRVSVVNALPMYLVLDEVDLLAGIDSGKISFTGTAGSAPGLTLRPFANGVTTPELNVQLTSNIEIGTTSEGAGASLFVTGPVNNMLGSVDLSVANGSLIQQAPINATSITIDVPNGVFFVDGNPPIPYEGVAGDIQDAWLNVASSNVTATAGNNQYGSESQTVPTVTSFFLPGLTSSGYSPNLVVTTAVDSQFNPNGISQSAFTFVQQHVVGTTSNTTNGTGTSYIYFGDAMPYLWGTGNDDGSSYAGTQAQTGSNSNFLTNSSNGLTYTIGTGGGMGNTPLIMPNLPLTATGTTAAPAAQNLTGSINAAAVSITAGIIDLNGPMNVGHTVNAQVTLSPGLGLLLRQYQTAYDGNPGTVAAIYNIPASLLPEAISASYNCLTGAITVGPIVAAPDVEVILTGQMISSVTGAAINLSGGLGNCQVDNQTGLPVVLAGVGSGPTSTQGTVTINDTWANQTTIYTYSPGEPVQVYSGTLNQVTTTGTPTSTVSGTAATFQPTDNTIYTWTNAASVSRPGNDASTTPATWGYPAQGAGSFNYSGDWTFYTGTADAPYVASNGTLSVSSSANPAVFSEQVSATINQSYSLEIQYNSNDKDSYGFGSNFTQTYIYPYDITVTATSSILVDNPVAINFGGITGGTLVINSNANVILGGSVALVGAVTAQVNGSLLQQSSAVLSATSLDLNAVGGTIGIAAQPLTVAMIGSGAVSATGSEGVYLASTGDLVIDTISTQQASGVTVPGGKLISGFGDDGLGWTLVNNGGFHASIADNVLSLTQAGSTDTANAAWFDTPLAVNQPFAVGFSYQGQANGADGVALVFQNSSSGTSAVGSTGGGVGYAGIGNSLALVLDIYSGNGANGSGMAIATNGASWTLTNTGPVALDSSHLIDVVFSYDPVAQTVTVVLTDTVNGDQSTSVTTGIDLATITGGNTATLGFTGADGGTTSNQSVRNFTWYSIAASSTAQGPVVGMGTNGSGWNLANNGGTTANISNNLLTLTTAGTTNTANAAWYGTPVRVDQPFAVTYTYTGQANGADGVAFVLQNDGRGTSAVGGGGGGVGYAGIVSSVAVILDIFSDNGAEGAGFQFATQGNIGTSNYSSTSPVALNSGHPIEVSLVFNPLTETLNVTLVDTVTGQLLTSQQANVNIAQIVGANTAILGFTGGDGGTTSTQTIGDFQYQPLQSASFQTGNAGWNSVASSGAVTPSILNNAVTVTTQSKPNSATALWYGTPLPVASSFQVDFTYTGQAGGDQGLALVFQNDPSGLTALGSAGTGYGYAGMQNSVGLLLGIGGGTGTALATDGVIPPMLPTGSVNLASGHPIAVSLVYNVQQNLLVETLTDTVTNQTFTTSYTQSSLADVLLGQSAYVGFTGGTATNGSNQSVSNFSIVTLAQAPIVLSAHGSLLAASGSSLVQGNILVLEAGVEAITGTIGTATTPLPIQITAATGLGGSQSGSLSATAPGDITLVANSGNMVVDSIVSTQGNVSLTAGAGSILSASGLTSLNIPMDVLSGAQLQQMLAEINQLAQTSTAATVDSFEATVNQLYSQYWGILGNSTFTANNLTANGGTLTGGGITVQPLTPGQIPFSTNATGGVFYLALTNTQGVQGTTTALAWNSTAAQVAAAVNSLQDANGNSLFTPLTVTGSGTAADPWILSGQSVANLTGASAALTGGTLSLGAPTPGSVPVFVTASAGTFTLTLTNPAGATGTTAALAWNSTASQVAAALAALTTTGGAPLATGLTVSGSGTANDPWIVAGEAMVSLTANGTALAGAALTRQPLTQASIPLSTTASGGTFTLTLTNTLGISATTVPLDWNSTANEVALALDGLTDAAGNSLVSGLTVTGAGTPGNPWVVSGATGQYVFNNAGLTGGTGTVGTPTAASVQLVSPVATGGTFTLSLQAAPTGTTQTTGSLAWNATASQLAAALNALPGIGGMTVTGMGTTASPWIITGPALSVGYVLNSGAYAFYQPMVQAALNLPAGQSATATQTQQVISGMAQNCVNMFVNPMVFGPTWASQPQFVAYDPNYQFVATPTQIADLTYGATYGFPDLAVLEVDALTPFNPDSVTEPVQPQIVGQNIILSATGSVGLVNQTTVITLEDIQNQTLTPSQQSSLALATSSGGPLLMVGTRTTGEQVTYTYGNLPAGVTPLGVQAQLDVPLFVDLAPTGTLGVQGNSQVAVTEVSGDLNLASAISFGPVHLTADGSVVADTPAAPGMVSGTALSGFGNNGTGWTINTNATSTSGYKATINNNALTLTNDAFGSTANAVWYDAQVLVTNGFTATFDYQVNTTTGADGVAFVIQNSTAGLSALGGAGGGVGYSGISQSLAVAFDIYSGNGVNGSGLQVATNGTLGSFGATSPVELNSGGVISVTITYNAEANTLEVTLQEYGKTFTQTFDSIHLESLLGQETGWVGFTGGDGGVTSTQTISNFALKVPVSVVDSISGIELADTVAPLGTDTWAVVDNAAFTPTATNGVLTLTKSGIENTASAAWYGQAVSVTSPFEVQFTYTGQSGGADGVAFVLQNSNQGLTALGGAGGGVGYSGISNSLAFIVDIYSGGPSDGSGIQIAQQGVVTNTYLTPGSVQLDSGDPIEVSLTYNPGTQTLTYALTNSFSKKSFSGQTTGINLSAILGSGLAMVGFTGGDGGITSTQTISDFTFAGGTTIIASALDISSGTNIGQSSTAPLTTRVSGEVNLYAGGSLWISQPTGTLTLGQIQAIGSVNITAAGSVAATTEPGQGTIASFSGTGSGWDLAGSAVIQAAVNPTDSNLQLAAANTANAASAAWYPNPVLWQNSFSTGFVINPITNPAGLGLTFTLQNDSRGTGAVGGSGASLGYGGTNAIQNSVSVQLQAAGTQLQVGLGSNGQLFNLGQQLVANVNLADPLQVILHFDSTAGTLGIQLINTTTGATPLSVALDVDLLSILNSGTALMGFTGASTGGSSSALSVTNFYFAYGAPNITAGDLSITSEGSIGSAALPLVSEVLGTGEVNLTAADNITLLALVGDLNVGTITAGGTATLLVPDGSVVASSSVTPESVAMRVAAPPTPLAGVRVTAQTLQIDARDHIGALTAPLVTEVDEFQARAAQGDLALSNLGSLRITASPRLQGVTAGQSIQIVSSVGLRVEAPVEGGRNVALSVPDLALGNQSLTVTTAGAIESLAGRISLAAPDVLQLQPGSVLRTAGGTAGEMTLALNRLTAGTSAALIQAQGRIIADHVRNVGAAHPTRLEINHAGLQGVTGPVQAEFQGTSGADLVLISDLLSLVGRSLHVSDSAIESEIARIANFCVETILLELGEYHDNVVIEPLTKVQTVDLRGNAGDDQVLVQFAAGGTTSVLVDGGTGTNTLTYDGGGLPMWVKLGRIQTLSAGITHQNLRNLIPRNIAALNGNPYASTIDVAPLLVGLTATQRYVQATYLQILQRVATTAELNQWTGYIDQAPTDLKRRTLLVDTLSSSDAARTLLLQAWFQTYAGRLGTAAEITTWLATFRTVSNPLTVQQRFLNSAPVVTYAQSLSAYATADQRYIDGLWRLLTDPGTPNSLSVVNCWLSQQTKLGRARMTLNMLGHLTYVSNQSQAFTQLINQRNAQYDTLLARAPALVTFTGGTPLPDLSNARVISPFELWRWLLTNRTA